MGKEQDLDGLIGSTRGLSRGFPKGQSVEAGREQSAARRRAIIPEGKADLLIIEAQHEGFFELDLLLPQGSKEAQLWVPRVGKFGEVITTRWDTPRMQLNEERRHTLKDPDEYADFYHPGHVDEIDLSSFPKSWSVARLIPQVVPDGIEAALRQQDEIRHDYGVSVGIEQTSVEELLVGIHELTEYFLYGEVSESTLREITLEASQLIQNTLGIDDPRDEIKGRVVKSIMRAGKRDSLGRVNPLVSRVLLRSAYLNTVSREVVTRLSREKSERVFELLLVERNMTRLMLGSTMEAIEYYAGLGNEFGEQLLTDPYYEENSREITNNDIHGLRDNMKAIVDIGLKPVRVMPYIFTARLSEAMLTSELLRNTGDDVALKGLLRHYRVDMEKMHPSAEELVRKREMADARNTMRHVHGLIEATLDDPDNSVYTVFSEQ